MSGGGGSGIRRIWPAAAVLAVFVLLRVAPLTHDPPASLVTYYHDVGSSVFDEGWWTAHARDVVLFEDGAAAGFDLFWVSPVFSWIMTAAFSAGGVSLATARLTSVLFGVLGLVLLMRADRDRSSTGLAAALIWSVSFAASGLGRLALPESIGTTLALAAAALVLRGGARAEVLGGIAAATAVLVKPHFAFLVPTIIVSAGALAVRGKRSALAAALRAGAGAAVPVLAWVAFVAANRVEAQRVLDFYDMGRWVARNPAELGALVALAKPAVQNVAVGIVYRHPLFTHFPVVFVLAAIAVPPVWTALRRPEGRGDVPDAVLVFGTWVLFASLELAVVPFQPLRYFLPMLPALAYLAAWVMMRPAATAATATTAGPELGPLGRVLAWGAVAFVSAQIVFAALQTWAAPHLVALAQGGEMDPLDRGDYMRLTPFLIELVKGRSLEPFRALQVQQAYFGALVTCGMAAVVAGAAAAAVAAGPLARVAARTARARALPFVLVAYQVLLWGMWLPERDRSLVRMGADLGRVLDDAAVVSPGGTFALENKLRFDSSVVPKGRMYDTSGAATHFLLMESHPLLGTIEPGAVERKFDGVQRVKSYELTGGFVYGLYRAGD